MIELSERNTQMVLDGLKLLKEYNKNPLYRNKDIDQLIKIIDHNNIDRRITYLWKSMLDRCRNPHNKFYKTYGGRGISVCEEWKHLKNFKNWCYENGYQLKLTIDRINVNDNYCPENCRLITIKEQQRNRRNNRMIKDPFDGEVLCLSAVAEKYKISIQTLSNRLNKQCLSIEQALTKPFRKQRYYASKELKPLTIADRLMVWHDTKLNVNDEYTLTQAAMAIDAEINSVKSAAIQSRNKKLAGFLSNELIKTNVKGTERTYIKIKNWLEE